MAEAINRIVTVWEVDDSDLKRSAQEWEKQKAAIAGSRTEITKLNAKSNENKLAEKAAKAEKEMRDLEKETKKLNSTLDKTKVKINAAMNPAKTRSQNVAVKALSTTYKGLLAVGRSLLTVFGPLIAAFGAVEVIRALINVTQTYEDSLADLSAITGLVGNDLSELSDEAIRVGKELGKAPNEILTTYKLIASAKPDLLENIDLLGKVAEQAIILSKAAPELGLEGAAQNLGIALNALELPAEKASDLINILAAASQKGAKEIPFIVDALTKVGGIAASANEPVESLTAAIEILGAKIPEASVVGTNLRAVFTKLIVESERQGRAFLGLSGELDLLAEKNVTVTELTKLFGDRNLLAIQTLISQRKELGNLTKAITGTSTATEQAEKRARTITGLWAKFTAELQASVLEANGVEGAFTGLVKNGINFLRAALETISGTFRKVSLTIDNFFEDINSLGRGLAGIGQIIKGAFLQTPQDVAQGLEQVKEAYNAILLNQAEEEALSKEVSDNLKRIWDGAIKQTAFDLPAPNIPDIANLADGFELIIPVDVVPDPGGDIVPALGLIDQIKAKIEEFQKSQKAAVDPEAVKTFSREIENLKAQLNELENPTKVLEARLKAAFDETQKKIKATLEDLRDLKTELKEPLETRTVIEDGLQFDRTSAIGLQLDEVTEQIAAKAPGIIAATKELVKGFNLQLTGATQFELDLPNLQENLAIASEVLGTAFDAISTRRIESIDRQLEALEFSYQTELELANNNEAGKLAAKERFETRRLALEKERAKQEKKQALFSAVLTQANNILKALGTPPVPNFGAAAIAGGLGLIQIAAIASSNPGFFRGTGNAPEGFATVGEYGPELRESKGKFSIVGGNGPETKYLDRGDKIYKNTDPLTMQALKDPDQLSFMNNRLLDQLSPGKLDFGALQERVSVKVNVNNGGNEKLFKEMRKLNRTMATKPVPSFSFDEHGFNSYLTSRTAAENAASKRNTF